MSVLATPEPWDLVAAAYAAESLPYSLGTCRRLLTMPQPTAT